MWVARFFPLQKNEFMIASLQSFDYQSTSYGNEWITGCRSTISVGPEKQQQSEKDSKDTQGRFGDARGTQRKKAREFGDQLISDA